MMPNLDGFAALGGPRADGRVTETPAAHLTLAPSRGGA